MFVDGVRRVDARVWIHDGDRAHAGVCASVGAGIVECDRVDGSGHRVASASGR